LQSRLLTIKEQWLLLGVGAAIVFGASVLIWRGSVGNSAAEATFPVAEMAGDAGSESPDRVAREAPPVLPPVPAPDTPEAKLGVGIIGAINRPGLYFFEPGSRVKDLIARAGGSLPESDLSDINRTALLIDETTLLVPRLVVVDGVTYRDPAEPHNPAPYTRSTWYQLDRGASGNVSPDGPNAARNGGTPALAGGRVNINTATQQALERLPGIGPVTASKIIAYRQLHPFARIEDLEQVSGIGPAKMAAVRDLITVD